MPHRAAGAVAVLGLCLALGTAAGFPPEGADAYLALQKKYDDALDAYQKALQQARTPQEKRKAQSDKHPRVGEFATQFMALADKFPGSDSAVDALFWVATHPVEPTSPEAGLRARALTTLARDHVKSDKVGRLCTLLVFAIDPATDEFLRGVVERAKQAPVLARARASLAVNLKHRARLVTALKDSPDAIKQYQQAFGKKAVRLLLESDPAKLRAESEKLFEGVIASHGEMPHPTHGSMAKFARRHLLAMRKPVDVDRVAPNIVGEDVAGKKLRLADFKGNVVLLDFWAHAFAPSRAMYDYERGLVKRLAGKPFVLLGVNGDGDRKALQETMAKEKITWRSFWDAEVYGPIATRWEVDVRPSLFLIDHKGVIRHYFAGWPETKKLDRIIDELVREARRNP